MSGLDCLGATEIGLDAGGGWTQGLGNILQAAGGLATGITSTVEQAQAEKKLKADQEAALRAAVAADSSAASAIAKASVSAKLKSASAAMDQKAAEVAVSAQQQAAAKLSGDASEVRAQVADKARAAAISAAQAAPNDAYKAALVDAWTSVINQSNNAAIVKKDQEASAPAQSGESFLTKKLIGPVPTWGVGVGAVAAGLLAKRFLLK